VTTDGRSLDVASARGGVDGAWASF